jgi:hypothetical protein
MTKKEIMIHELTIFFREFTNMPTSETYLAAVRVYYKFIKPLKRKQ